MGRFLGACRRSGQSGGSFHPRRCAVPGIGRPMAAVESRPGPKAGSTVRTANDSHADLFMDQNGPVVRLVENTTLGLDKLNYTATGVDTIIETQLDLKSGRIIGIVRKMADQSKYEIKTPNGVAGIRGTEYDITATSVLRVVSGSMVMVYVKSDGTVITQVVNSNEMFVPSDGTVKLIPADQLSQLVPEIRDMEGAPVVALTVEEPIKVFITPLAGIRQ